MRNKKSQIFGLKIFAIAFLLAILIDLSGTYFFYQKVLSFIEDQPEIQNADAGIIFFGDYHPDKLDLGSDSKNRANIAIQLYKKGIIKDILAIGGFNYKNRETDIHLMREYLVQHEIPNRMIFHDTLSFNTITNWQEAQKIMSQNHFNTVIAISAPLHIYRIANMIDKQNVSYATYQYKLDNFNDYYDLYQAVHHEWKSYLLSFLFEENLRNKISYHVRKTLRNIKNFFRSK